jgi:hypothetical protein
MMTRAAPSQKIVAKRHPALGANLLLQRKCACGGTLGPTGECEECRKKRPQGSALHLQPKLVVSPPGDGFEQEADHVADADTSDSVVSMSKLTPCNNSESAEIDLAPSLVDEVGQSSGQPLDMGTRARMTQRFGYDFGRVRVHTDARANESAQAVNAHAYTVGRHIVFASGRYDPSTIAGQKLLAHELTHVIQQSSGSETSLQRDDAKPEERIDVAIVFGDEPEAMVEGKSYAPTAIRVTSGEDAKNKLLALGKPLGRIYVVSHSTRAGEVQVISGIGTISWVKLSDLSKDIKGIPADKAPTDIDFRGCKLGEAPQQMETFRKNIGATKARGMTCWSIVATVTPLVLPDGTPLTDPSQIPQGKEGDVDKALVKQINGLKSDDGHPVKDCIEGLAAGETADRNLGKIKQLYFQHKGNLSATWASPEYNHNWQQGSMCVKDLTATTSPCKIVTTSAPAATTGSSGGRSSMVEQPSETQYAGDLVSTKEGESIA